MSKIGIFSGTFDPVHVGHIEVALAAQTFCGLDKVLFLTEKSPHRKVGVADYKDRLAMLKLAISDHDNFEAVQVSEPNITTQNTLHMLQQKYPKYQPVIIIGSDMLKHLDQWEDVDQLLERAQICVVLRSSDQSSEAKALIKNLQAKFPQSKFQILPPISPKFSSSNAKKDLTKQGHSDILHKKVIDYILKNKLYKSSSPRLK